MLLAAVSLLALSPLPAAALAAAPVASASSMTAGIPDQLTEAQRTAYRAVFAAIRDQRWTDAQLQLDSMEPGPLHAFARAELYTAKGSPRVELDPLVKLLNEAPELPQAEQIARLAQVRGGTALPPLPVTQRLIWQDGAPTRIRAKSIKSDLIAADLAAKMQPYIKDDLGGPAQALLDSTQGLSNEAATEWRAKVAWMYFLQGDDTNARFQAALAQNGEGDWALQARWMGALSAWRQGDYPAAESAFEGVAARATDNVDLRSAGLYWAARADTAAGRPDRVEARLKTASQYRESFYGQLARQALGLRDVGKESAAPVTADWTALQGRPNVRVAAALVEIGETDEADAVIRQQARIGDPREFASLTRLTSQLNLPASAVWLAHNCPQGVTATAEARFPMPRWTPDTGWRVDKALVFAHALQESGFRNTVVSPAGAYGLMQIMPAAATDYSRERGLPIDRSSLSRPSTNIDIGQRHLEKLRDMGLTGGLLPKVIAAYNAGPKPVQDWNSIVHDNGDPLLYIESIPYWETRGYVTTVLRNYWMYERQAGKTDLPSRSALAQGMWPRFPGLKGASAVRLDARPNATQQASLTTAQPTIAVNATPAVAGAD
ncbi:Lytic transglycosylase [Sphingomonas sp. EC-HK361]|uniref:lytic transglycosylase domain-containing protein n=1 Tax=Sphingomonas sp. EC-HK361 TaxID=2038397 RepID=UPI001254E6F7|nr:lytic transglycosylase domain-containing protein [Sphingomonas sp. EC-HK361]VVT03193.1 Lytic transglycosylase [Sphingomonas sp. EC-HK361]